MKSGHDDYSNYWGNPFYDEVYEEIQDHGPFVKKVFHPMPALRAHNDAKGYTEMRPYEGGHYDSSQYELLPNAWKHEHCKVCFFRIEDGHSYWANEDEDFLCDACYEHYVLKQEPTA